MKELIHLDIESITLSRKSNFMQDYLKQNEDIMKFFEYKPLSNFKERLEYLKQKSFKREELVKVLHKKNEEWGATEESLQNIQRLKDEEALVVIGGQQAGLLSGPTYTVNKVISIIKLARQQEEVLQVPVIPVFWIAGEDHDYEEINHTYLLTEQGMIKHQINQHVQERTPVSDIKMDQALSLKWIDELFLTLEETSYTKDLYKLIQNCLNHSHTYVDFFARFINELFRNEGLVLIDSNDKEVRQLESNYFEEMILKQNEISERIYRSTQLVRQSGYELTIEPELEDAHIFYHLEGERILLVRNDEDLWLGKQNEIELSTKELLQIAKEQPEKLSNNVVTRPLMQDLLFPTLAFVGGWGEISYWSVLKDAFASMDLKMPPIVPRLSFTYVEPKVAKLVERYSLHYEEILSRGVGKERINWISSQEAYPTKFVAEQIKEDIDELHKPLRKIAEDISPNLKELSEANLYFIQEKLDYLLRSIEKEVAKKHKKNLVDFSDVEFSLFPNSQLQERIFNPCYLLNYFGGDFIHKMIGEDISFEQEHYLVFL